MAAIAGSPECRHGMSQLESHLDCFSKSQRSAIGGFLVSFKKCERYHETLSQHPSPFLTSRSVCAAVLKLRLSPFNINSEPAQAIMC